MPRNLIFSKDIVAKYNIPYSTVMYYTNMGFFTVVMRKGNRKMYDEEEVRTHFQKITKLVNEGYPLHLIRKILLQGTGTNRNELL